MDTADFLDARHANLSPVQRAMVLDDLADAREAVREQRTQAAKQAAKEERAELLALACRQGGVQPGEIQRLRSLAADADDEVRDLADRLAQAEAKRAHVTGNLQSLLRQVDEVNQAVTLRSAPPEDPVGRAVFEARAQAREHTEYLAATRAAWQRVQGGKPARRPFVSRSAAGDGEPDCPECLEAGASISESFLLHSDPWPVDPDSPPAAPDNEATDHPVRAAYSASGWEISR